MLVLVKGAGDLASGVACRLFRAGFQVIMTDIAQPTVIRRTVSFAQAVYDGKTMVEDIEGVLAKDSLEAMILVEQRKIPVLVDPKCEIAQQLKFDALVDGVLAKKNIGTRIDDAPIVVALGPGFTAGVDCHAVIETQRGHDLARVILEGSATPDTGVPGMVGGYALERLIKSPAQGKFITTAKIGDLVKKDQSIGYILGENAEGQEEKTPVVALIDGVLRGILQDGLPVFQGMKIGDVDPRPVVNHCFSVSDKARAIGGGVLEAILRLSVEHNPNFWK